MHTPRNFEQTFQEPSSYEGPSAPNPVRDFEIDLELERDLERSRAFDSLLSGDFDV